MNNFKDVTVSHSSGVVTLDPLADAPAGTTVTFKSEPLIPRVPIGAATVSNWDHFRGILLSTSFATATCTRVEGSAVLVAPGIAITATHVIASHLPLLMAGAEYANCFGITPHGLQIWNVRKVTVIPDSDFTILGLEFSSALPPENTFFQSCITTRTPAIGENLTIVGFRANSNSFQMEAMRTEMVGSVWVSKGDVTDVYPAGRDRSMIPWPVIAIATPAHGGMSGGPVYDQFGLLIGLLCSSIELADGAGISYVSSIWPALTTRFEGAWPSGFYKSVVSLSELDPQICFIDKREAVTAAYETGTGRVRTKYVRW